MTQWRLLTAEQGKDDGKGVKRCDTFLDQNFVEVIATKKSMSQNGTRDRMKKGPSGLMNCVILL